mmetsp:Transcript_14362/g.28888  ORF Transcript_14362/g.28888 Transcript_14362/m.28888 type:complete len:167 (+) Transcript_14362:424-924(+)
MKKESWREVPQTRREQTQEVSRGRKRVSGHAGWMDGVGRKGGKGLKSRNTNVSKPHGRKEVKSGENIGENGGPSMFAALLLSLPFHSICVFLFSLACLLLDLAPAVLSDSSLMHASWMHLTLCVYLPWSVASFSALIVSRLPTLCVFVLFKMSIEKMEERGTKKRD